jgi:hypothetical protein
MTKIRLIAVLLVAATLLVVVVVHAESGKEAQPAKANPKAASQLQETPASAPQTPAYTGSKQGYKVVTDVVNTVSGKFESDNWKIPYSSGGEPILGGFSQSENWGVSGGYVEASTVLHGDANSDGAIGPGDIVALINYLYRSGPAPCPLEAGDANCDGSVGPGDIVYLINYLYRGGPPPSC